MQVTARRSLAHAARTEGEVLELSDPNDPVLPLGKRGDLGIDPKTLYFRDHLSRFYSLIPHRSQRVALERAWG
jgi:hypothetical protein